MTKSWKKKSILCYHCGGIACSEIVGDHGKQWYCFRCAVELFPLEDEDEVDESLQVCSEQLELQSEAYS